MRSKNHSYKLALAAGAIAAALVTSNAYAQQGMGIGNNNPQEMLDVSGAIKLGTTTSTNAGTIRWTGTEFQGWDGTQWITFGGGIATQLTEAQVEAFVTNGPIDLFAGTTLNGSAILTTEVDGSITNEIQDLQLVGNILTITNNGTATQIDLSPYVNAAVTLDAAYDQGGAGQGREINATDGAVRINGDDGFLVTGTVGSGDAIEVSGAGTRMFFNPKKAAVRAGYVNGNQWDDANIGNYSTAMGYGTSADGARSTAMGNATAAQGASSTAMGSGSIAIGESATAMGYNSTAEGVRSTAIGNLNLASGDYSTALGNGTTALADESTALGYTTTASGYQSTAMGSNTASSGSYSTAMGSSTTASGATSTAMGSGTTASGPLSTAMGANTTASEFATTAMGWYSNASGQYSTAMGSFTAASGFGSTALGESTIASGRQSLATGFITTASGYQSTSTGYGTTAPSFVETTVGSYNTTYTPASASTWNTADRLFVIGNGTSNSAQSNALTIYKDGRMNINDAYDMPTTDGAAGQVMTTDGAGTVSFVDPNTLVTPTTTNTLDAAYDQGGAGLGREINATDGAVRINGDDGFLVTGTVGSGDAVEVSGAGARMFYNPKKAAFRAGRVLADQWDDANVGNYSTALGASTTASGDYATALGAGTTSSGVRSTAMGSGTIASGDYSTALGDRTEASGLRSTATGVFTIASGDGATAMGAWTTAPSYLETAIGRYTTTYTPSSATAWNTADRLFVIGNGTGSSATSDALVVLKNGNTGFGTSTPASNVHIKNTGDASIWIEADSDNATESDNAYLKITQDGSLVNSIIGLSGANNLSPTGDAYTDVLNNALLIGTETANADLQLGTNNAVRMTIAKTTGNVGIGTITPTAKLHVAGSVKIVDGNQAAGKVLTSDASGLATWQTPAANTQAAFTTTGSVTSNAPGTYATDDFVFGSPQLADNGNTANDNRFLFDKSKGAFRAGSATGTQWDNGNRGIGSIAMGYNSIALGNYATALGVETTASGASSFASGQSTNASGSASTAMGYFTTASAYGSTAMGANTTASLFGASAMGFETTASGESSTAMGRGTIASGLNSIAMGLDTRATGTNSTAMGAGTAASGYASTAMGELTVASGSESTAMGFQSTASGNTAIATGTRTEADGSGSTAMGYESRALGVNAVALGFQSEAWGHNSISMGYRSHSSGINSLSIGYEVDAWGDNSTAMGEYVMAGSFVETAVGRYNTTYTPASATGWNPADRLFVIGNGTSSSARSDALVVLKNGNTGFGTSTPASNVHIKSTGDASIWIEADSDNAIESDNAYLKISQDGNLVNSIIGLSGADNLSPTGDAYTDVLNNALLIGTETANADLQLGTNNAVRMTIAKTTGRVGIRTTAPSSDLHLKMSASDSPNPTTGGITLEQSNSTAEWQIWNSDPYLSFARNNVRVAYVNNTSGAWTVTSDRRVKKDIEPMEDVLSKVMQLNTVKYRYNHNTDDATKTRGFIAQEVQEVFPDLVYTEDGSQLGIAPSDFGILSIKAIQEQQAQIEAQQQVNEQQQALIEQLLQRIQQLENK